MEGSRTANPTASAPPAMAAIRLIRSTCASSASGRRKRLYRSTLSELDSMNRMASEVLTSADTLIANVVVSNTGTVAGDEVVQLYVSYDGSAVERADFELKAFARVHLEPGDTKGVELLVPMSELAYFDTSTSAWVIESLNYGIHVGPNARDLPLSDTVAAGP